MANQAPKNSGTALEALCSFLTVVLLVAAGILATATFVFLPRICTLQSDEFTVVPADVNARLEYCVAQAVPQYKAARKSVVHPGASCGPDKASLLAQAESMTEQARAEMLACQARSTPEKVELLLKKFKSYLS